MYYTCRLCSKDLGELQKPIPAYPFCKKEDEDIAICRDCKNKFGNKALATMARTCNLNNLRIKDTVVIFYSSCSNEPLNYLKMYDTFLTGMITKILVDRDEKSYYGTWGDFSLTPGVDNFTRLNYS